MPGYEGGHLVVVVSVRCVLVIMHQKRRAKEGRDISRQQRGGSPALASATCIPLATPTSPAPVDPIVTMDATPLWTDPMLAKEPRMEPGMEPLSSTSPCGIRARSR